MQGNIQFPKKLLRKDARAINHDGSSGVLMAIGAIDLVRAAHSAGCTIELMMQLGNFILRDDPLFRTFPPDRPVDPGILHQKARSEYIYG